MARAIITPELAETIRGMRIQSKIQAKALATHIGKSPAYISKLEKGNIQTIENNELIEILKFILKDDSNIDEIAEKIYASLKFKYSKKEIEDQLWFTNFDTVVRKLPIPEALIDDINNRIISLNIDESYLLLRINSNEALDDEEINNENITFNQWYHQGRLGGSAQSIKVKLKQESLHRILRKEKCTSPYVFIFCIMFYLMKIEMYGDRVKLSDEENKLIMAKTTDMLNQFKFYSIAEKDALISERKSQEEQEALLSSFDRENLQILNDILSGFKFASELDIKMTNSQLESFRGNMRWDLGFMLKLVSLNFRSLEKTSVSNKRELLTKIETLIDEFSKIPEKENKIETY